MRISQKHKNLDILRMRHYFLTKEIHHLHIKSYFMGKDTFVVQVTFKWLNLVLSRQFEILIYTSYSFLRCRHRKFLPITKNQHLKLTHHVDDILDLVKRTGWSSLFVLWHFGIVSLVLLAVSEITFPKSST